MIQTKPLIQLRDKRRARDGAQELAALQLLAEAVKGHARPLECKGCREAFAAIFPLLDARRGLRAQGSHATVLA